MELRHGNTPQDRYARVGAIAYLIYSHGWRSESNPTGVTREDLRDPSDINAGEDAEIEAAERLAEEWWSDARAATVDEIANSEFSGSF